jgi:DNA polymerase I-like protein with 3'-5' exonuclease and polymerase domains
VARLFDWDKVEKLYAVLDLETTIKAIDHPNKATPWWPDNYLVQAGYSCPTLSDNIYTTVRSDDKSTTTNEITFTINSDSAESKKQVISTLVAHNAKFDLGYLFRFGKAVIKTIGEEDQTIPIRDLYADSNFQIWDTGLVEYLLSNQTKSYPSLDYCAEKYGGELKDDRIKAFWQAGVQTEDIPEDLLEEYLKGDVKNTGIVYKKQLERCLNRTHPNFIKLVKCLNDAVIAQTEMEMNGMAIDSIKLRRLTKDNKTAIESSINQVYKTIVACPSYWGADQGYIYANHVTKTNYLKEYLNLNSSSQLSAVLFGGIVPAQKEKVKIGHYKNGNPKYKTERRYITFKGFCEPDPEWATSRKDRDGNAIYSTSTEVLNKLLEDRSKLRDIEAEIIIQTLTTIRGLEKERTSYLEKIPGLLINGLIHPNINNTATSTGRLSQDNPNLQNITNKASSELKTIFVSRYGEDGYIVEADYKQLEVLGLAILSQDPVLINDLANGRDIHYEVGREAGFWRNESQMTKDGRRKVKAVVFGLIYGGGINTLSKQSGLNKNTTKDCINSFYTRYTEVQKWHSRIQTEVKESAELTGFKTSESRLPVYAGYYTVPTGRSFKFYSTDPPDWMVRSRPGHMKSVFKPTEIKNYPVQGFATGDIVAFAYGLLFRAILNKERQDPEYREKVRLINTVHDSIVLDVHKDKLEEACELVKYIMEEGTTRLLNQVFNINLPVNLKTEISYGPNWKDQKELEVA